MRDTKYILVHFAQLVNVGVEPYIWLGEYT